MDLMDFTGTKQATLAELLALHLRTYILAQPTKDRYDLVARNLARYMGGTTSQPSDVRLDNVTSEVMLGFRTWSLQRMKAVSFNTERRHLSVLFNAGIEAGLMTQNPTRRVPAAPVLQTTPKALTKAAIAAYMDWLRTSRQRDPSGRPVDVIQPQWFWYAVLRTFYFTGMRKRQLIGLVWDDIDFEAKTILLAARTSKTRREWKVPLPEPLRTDLEDLRAKTRAVCKASLGQRQVFCLPLFHERPASFRHPSMTADNLDNFFQKLRRAMPVDVPRLSAHRIRHTTCTILANKVRNLKVVQQQLGHSSITTTYQYVHPDIDAMRKALKGLV
jgi:integrase